MYCNLNNFNLYYRLYYCFSSESISVIFSSKNLSPIRSLAAAFLPYPKVQEAAFSYLFEHCATHLADVPVALIPYFSDPC